MPARNIVMLYLAGLVAAISYFISDLLYYKISIYCK